jgi:hypothetical protein
MNKRILWSSLFVSSLVGTIPAAHALAPDQMPATGLKGMHAHSGDRNTFSGKSSGRSPSGLPGIDSIANFTGGFFAAGFDPNGNPLDTWSYAMVGNSPARGGTTIIGAPIIPVSIDLRNANGSPRYVNGQRLYSDATKYVRPVLNSPVFSFAMYPGQEQPTQFVDAVHRASFSTDRDRDGDDDSSWHTLLAPEVRTPRVMTLLAGSYYFALNDDGSCCSYILADENAFDSALFPSSTPDLTTPVGAAEVSHEMTTKDLSSFIFPNTYLYENGDPNQCCVLGYHTFDYEPGDKSNGNLPRFYIVDYASWITPGLFGDSFADITGLSHEVSEIYADPFVAYDNVHNVTPWWLAPNGNCQDDLETGDVIEGLPNATYPVKLNGFTYNPQNEAQLQWFTGGAPGLGGSYSYPDPTVLPTPAAPQNYFCQ